MKIRIKMEYDVKTTMKSHQKLIWWLNQFAERMENKKYE